MTKIPDGGKLHADHWSTEQQAALLQTSERKRATYDLIVQGLHVNAGLTDDELRGTLEVVTGRPQSKSGPATRRGELVDMGLVRPQRWDHDWADLDATVKAGEIVKRPSDLGGPMIVWELVPADEYVKPDPKPAERQPTAAGLFAAKRYAEWELGSDEAVGAILRAYLNPAVAAAELDEITGGTF